MRAERRWDVLVVGGGASGTLVAAQLLRNAAAPLQVLLLERASRVGPGLAYATTSDSHLLNVPAGKMSAFPEDPEHFLRWVRRQEPGTLPGDFVQRRRYGQYLESLLREAREHAAPGVVLETLTGEAVGLFQQADSVLVELADGTPLETRSVVLAVGNAPPANVPVPDGGLYDSPRYIRSPWARGALSGIEPHHSVLLIGTGLTMVDTALSLAERNHEGRIYALSRHGLLPHAHRRGVVPGPAPLLPEPLRVRSILHSLRQAACISGPGVDEEADWRAGVDSLRPVTAALWSGLGDAERRRFLRHLRSYWDVHRHRMAPAVHEMLQSLLSARVLRLHAGRLQGFSLRDDEWIEVRARPKGVVFEGTFRVQHVINCTGPDMSISRGHPLLRALLEQGLGQTDSLGLGLVTDAEGALLDAHGQTSRALFTLGSLRRGDLWESTAIPEIRLQAAALARQLLARTGSRPAVAASPAASPPPLV